MTDVTKLLPPADGKRVETGPIQFGDDWPGIFIRGDNALFFASFLSQLKPRQEFEIIDAAVLDGIIDVLRSCSVGGPPGRLSS